MKSFLSKICTIAILISGLFFGTFALPTPVYAEDDEPLVTETETPEPETPDPATPEPDPGTPDPDPETADNLCQEQTGSLSWIVCPSSGIIAGATDSIYAAIEDLLVVSPLSMDSSSPIYLTWQYIRNLTNIIFIIFLIIVIYSQLTSFGLGNYGIKRVLPRLIIAVVLVNLSFIICSLAVDISNIVGASFREFFLSIENTVISNTEVSAALSSFSLSTFLAAVISGGAIAGLAVGAIGGVGYIFYALLVVLFGALISVVTGFITIAARQALVALLVMISPLAFVAYLLPNTEKWFNTWKDMLFKMLIFYPMFSFLFGASQLVGYSLIASASSSFGIILGIAVQIFPLFFSWSLMKMSGTVLGTFNNALRRIASPMQRGFAGWSLSKAEQSRQHYIANSMMPGAKLRRYMDYRRELRELDTRNSMGTRKGQAVEKTLKTASSSLGRDANGNPQWDVANRYTRNAKRASLYETRGATAAAAYKNTLSGYGSHFHTDADQRLASAHAEAYKDAMAQQFLTVNEAQADQEYLLNEYLKAIADQEKHPREYNRLIKSAAGGLGHNGESSIMGQVIVGNSAIENRRRSEARIMITKFGIKKPQFRGMVFDKDHINDNGLATDAGGRAIENDQFRLIGNNQYTPWQHYIAVNKETGEEIDKDTYDAYLRDNPDLAKEYRKVRYFDITDDKGNAVQRVYEDDAGYMKELIRDDIAIGDPINRRYLTEIGVGRNGAADGILRRYHSTITSAMLETKYKEHAAEVTPMITAQANMGYIGSIGQYNIANLQSMSVSSKPDAFLQNDAYAINTWRNLILAANDPKKFAEYFPDEDIMGYLNVNGQALGGMYLGKDKDGNDAWIEMDADKLAELSTEQQLEYRRNLIKHKILPKAAKKLIGMANRKISPNVSEKQKPDTLEALLSLAEALGEYGLINAGKTEGISDERLAALRELGVIGDDGSISFKDRPNGRLEDNVETSLFGSQDPNALSSIIRRTQRTILGDSAPTASGTSGTSTPRSSTRTSTNTFMDQLERQREAEIAYRERNNIANIYNYINECCDAAVNTEALCDQILDYFGEVECLRPLLQDCNDIVNEYLYDDYADSTDEGIDQITNQVARERARIEKIRNAVLELIQRADFS